jgi:hypothetical protein
VSAFDRAKTFDCKERIENLACESKVEQKKIFSSLFDSNLNRFCSASQNSFKGCLVQNEFELFLNGMNFTESSATTEQITVKYEILNSNFCIGYCLTIYHNEYAAFDPNLNKCFCFKTISQVFLDKLTYNINDCDSNSFIQFYSTGLISKLVFIKFVLHCIFITFIIVFKRNKKSN